MESRETVLERVRLHREALRSVDKVWKSDHEVVLAAVGRTGWAFQFAADALKEDRAFVLAA
eukprot:5269739-Amphidinium_carterae.1